jgi:hypothetical protein
MLQIDLDSIKHAVALICRLGFARKKIDSNIPNIHQSWIIARDTEDNG